MSGTNDADCAIDNAWALGWTGAGVRVSVIDFHGFDLEHEDMNGQFVEPWDAVTDSPLPVGNHVGETYAHGMNVLIGSAGNCDSQDPNYPAAWPEVIGIIASNPDDLRKTDADGWEIWSCGGSQYGPLYDVAAPGTFIPGTDHSGSDGYNKSAGAAGNYYSRFNGTSAAAPVASGIAALLLQANPGLRSNLTIDEVRQAMIDGAEKVNSGTNPGNYDYNYDVNDPGRSLEMGYGRLNASNSLMILGNDASIEEPLASLDVRMAKNSYWEVLYDFPEKSGKLTLRVSDLWGRQINRITLPVPKGRIDISNETFSQGIYFLSIEDENRKLIKTKKMVKL